MKISRLRTAIFMPLVLCTLSGCGNTLFFSERTRVAIAAEFNATAVEPVELTVGYKRTIATLVPPQNADSDNPGQYRGEALSLISKFRLTYDENNDIHTQNFFVTGRAATEIGGSKETVDMLVNEATFATDDATADLLACWLQADDAAQSRLARLQDWVSENTEVPSTLVRFGEAYAAERAAAIDDLNVTCTQEN